MLRERKREREGGGRGEREKGGGGGEREGQRETVVEKMHRETAAVSGRVLLCVCEKNPPEAGRGAKAGEEHDDVQSSHTGGWGRRARHELSGEGL